MLGTGLREHRLRPANHGGHPRTARVLGFRDNASFYHTPSVADVVTRGGRDWEVVDSERSSNSCIPPWTGYCHEMKQVGHNADHLEVTFDVTNDDVEINGRLFLSFYWKYGCCAWDAWKGNCLFQR